MVFLIEKTGNLLSSSDSLAHCVSQNLRMGAGVARQIKIHFGNVQYLRSQRAKVGQVAYLRREDTTFFTAFPHQDRYVFYLVTKRSHRDKPTLAALQTCLTNLANICISLRLTKLSISRLGCGLDKLDWADVKQAIVTSFANIDIEITVYKFLSI